MIDIGLFLNIHLIMATILHYPVNIAFNVKIITWQFEIITYSKKRKS